MYTMQSETAGKIYKPLLYLFLTLVILICILQLFFSQWGINYFVLHAGNLLLFIVGWISTGMSFRALSHKNVQVFLRLVYGSFLVKFFVLAVSAAIYILIFRKNINKPAIFGCLAFYILYTFLEVRAVLIQSKKPNA